MSLTPEQDVALALLRVAARPQRQTAEQLPTRVSRADPARLLELLQRTRVDVALGPILVEDASVAMPAWFGDRVMAARALGRKLGLLQHGITQRLTSALRDQGVRVIPLKGTALADLAHGELGARRSQDIDLLVEPATMQRAVEVVSSMGWSESVLAAPPEELPRLHRVLVHPRHPPVELHWRVHWYEAEFSREAIARAVEEDPAADRLLPGDELATLLLFLARDGLTGLRLVADVAAWWRSTGADTSPAPAVASLSRRYPQLAPALAAAARWSEGLMGLERGSLMEPSSRLTRPQRLALRLANPWLDGSQQQIEAEVSLVDGLLAPAHGVGAFLRRSLAPPPSEALARNPGLRDASRARLLGARAGHAIRVVARYVLAVRRLTGRRGGATPAMRNARS